MAISITALNSPHSVLYTNLPILPIEKYLFVGGLRQIFSTAKLQNHHVVTDHYLSV
jgi:hypothetical protein